MFDDVPEPSPIGIATLYRLFPYHLHTFQYMRDGKSLVRTYKDANTAYKEALSYNLQGYDVYFMVNEGDGIVHTGKRIARSQANVLALTACFMDTDNCPIEKVDAYLESIGLVPHLRVESSPGRFHLYFLIHSEEPLRHNVDRWKAVQHMLHRLGDPNIRPSSLGLDGTMHDYSKVLRVPGFMHIKKTFLVSIRDEKDLPPYTLDDLYGMVGADNLLYDLTLTTSSVPDLNSSSIIEPGERYTALQSLALSLANSPDPDNFATFETFVKTRLDNSDHVYLNPDNTLTSKSLALFTSATDKLQRETALKLAHIRQSLEPKPSPWHLPDSFYLSAPNGFGDVVKQVMHYSLYPCAALAFGTFLTGLSILKSRTHLTPGGSSPALYTLNVAISGYGKGDPMALLQNMFVHLGVGKLIENRIRSDRGIYNHLAYNDGYGLFLLDEVAPLLKAIQDPKASSHHAFIAEAFLSLYSAGAMKGVSFGKLAASGTKKGEPEIIIDNPMLAICGFTVPSEFNKLFSEESVAKGLFQRFIPIVPEITYVKENENADKHALVKSDLFTSYMQANEVDETGAAVPSLHAPVRTRLRYTEEAHRHFLSISEGYRKTLIETAKDPEVAHTSGLYSRLAEQIERVASVLSFGDIDMTTLTYAQEFIESRHRAMLAVAGTIIQKTVVTSPIERETALVNAVARICSELDTDTITKRELYQRTRRSFKDVREFEESLKSAVELGQLVLIHDYIRPNENRKRQRPQMGIRLGEVC